MGNGLCSGKWKHKNFPKHKTQNISRELEFGIKSDCSVAFSCAMSSHLNAPSERNHDTTVIHAHIAHRHHHRNSHNLWDLQLSPKGRLVLSACMRSKGTGDSPPPANVYRAWGNRWSGCENATARDNSSLKSQFKVMNLALMRAQWQINHSNLFRWS